jgi:hypothetical protein
MKKIKVEEMTYPGSTVKVILIDDEVVRSYFDAVFCLCIKYGLRARRTRYDTLEITKFINDTFEVICEIANKPLLSFERVVEARNIIKRLVDSPPIIRRIELT